VQIPDAIAKAILGSGVVKSAFDVLPKDRNLSTLPQSEVRFAAELAELRSLLDVARVAASVQVFPDNGSHLGMCVVTSGGATVWINEKLFMPGQRFERIRTMIHEVAHAKGGDDGSVRFEYSLDYLGGTFAEAYLDSIKARG